MARGARRARALVVCSAGALALLFGDLSPVSAQTRTAFQAERDRRTETTRAQHLRAQADAARREVRVLDARMVEAGQRRAEAEVAAAAAEQRLTELRDGIIIENTRRTRARDAFESALIAAALAERRVEPRVIRVGIFGRAAAPEFLAAERRASNAMVEAHSLEAMVAEEQRVLAEAQAAIDAERTEIAALAARRRSAQTQFTQDAAAAERRSRALAAEARSLRELAQRASASSRRAAAPSPAGASVIPSAWLAPAEGQIVRGYGAAHAGAQASQGVALRTRVGAQVISPAAGEITYAGPFRSYGQVLILNVDGGYALVLTGLDSINVRVGETVRTGQPVGEMPASDTSPPELYVEVRRNGQPIDPGRWLAGRGATAERSVRAG